MMIKWFATQIQGAMGNGGDSVAAFFDKCGAYSLAGLEGKITCPLLSISGEARGTTDVGHGARVLREADLPKAEHIISLRGRAARLTAQLITRASSIRSSSTGWMTSSRRTKHSLAASI
jgi:pimeloyl-ACP methyl ester carboxylesterase